MGLQGGREILSSMGFDNNQIAGFERMSDYTEVMQQIITKQVDQSLDNLVNSVRGHFTEVVEERTQSLESKWAELKEVVLSGVGPESQDQASQDSSDVPGITQGIVSQMREQASKGNPITSTISNFAIDYINNNADSYESMTGIKKIFTGGLLSIAAFVLSKLGLGDFVSKLNIPKFSLFGSSEESSEQDDAIPEDAEESVGDGVDESNEVSVLERKNFYYRLGAGIAKEISNEQNSSGTDFGNLTEAFKDKTISEISSIDFDTLESMNLGFDRDSFEQFKRNISGADMVILYDNILTRENIELLLQKPRYKELLNDIGISNHENFNWSNLSLYDLFAVFSMTLTGLSLVGISTISGNAGGILSSISTYVSNFSGFDTVKADIESGVKQFEEEVISSDLSQKIYSKMGSSEKGSFDWDIDNFSDLSLNENDTLAIERLLSFRDYVSSEIISKDKYNLGKEELIRSKLGFSDVLTLYVLFKGEEINQDNFKSSMVYTWLINLLNEGGNNGGYIENLREETFRENSDRLSQDEQILLKVVFKKIIDKGVVNGLIEGAKRISGASVQHVSNNPEIVGGVIGLIAILRFTPAGRVVSVLYSLVGRRGMTLLVGSGAFAYLWNKLDNDIKGHIQDNSGEFEELFDMKLEDII